MMQRDIVVMEQHQDRLCCVVYQPGYEAQREIFKDELRNALTEAVPPVLIHLKGGHFNALVRSSQVEHGNVCELSD